MARGNSISELNEALKKLFEEEESEKQHITTTVKSKLPRVNKDEQIYESSCSNMGASD